MRTAADAAHQLAAAIGLVSAVRSLRDRRNAAELTKCLPRGLVLGAVEPTETDVVVAHARGWDGADSVIVKLARTPSGARSLRRACDELAELSADPRLDGWEVPRPQILGSGELGGLPYVVESALSGVTIATVLNRGEARAPVAALAMRAIDGMHRRSAEAVTVDPDLLDCWVDRPVQTMEPLVAASPRRAAAIRGLRRELRARLEGRKLAAGWIHGDYVPSNVLIDPQTGRITGIVDWELAGAPELPAIDRVTFLLAAHMQTTRRQLGAVVAAVVNGDETTSLRRSLAHAMQADLDDRSLVLLCWLRHVADLVTRSPRYATDRAWKRHNVYQVLDALAGARPRRVSTTSGSTH